MMTTRSPMEGSVNKRVRLDDEEESKTSETKLEGGEQQRGRSSPERTSPMASQFISDHAERAAKRPRVEETTASSSSVNDNNVYNKYQAALRRIVELELKANALPSADRSTSLAYEGVLSEDLVAARLQQIKQGKKPCAWPAVGDISEDLVAVRLQQLKAGTPAKANPAPSPAAAPATPSVGVISEDLVAARIQQLKTSELVYGALKPEAGKIAASGPLYTTARPDVAKPVASETPCAAVKPETSKQAASGLFCAPVNPQTSKVVAAAPAAVTASVIAKQQSKAAAAQPPKVTAEENAVRRVSNSVCPTTNTGNAGPRQVKGGDDKAILRFARLIF